VLACLRCSFSLADRVIAAFDVSVERLGFGEAHHGGKEIPLLRNRLFQRLRSRRWEHRANA